MGRNSVHRNESRFSGRLRRGLSAVILAIGIVAAASGPAVADAYDAEMAGHPIRISAYILHPFGVLIDTLIFRPAHWVGTQEPLKALFGHTD